MILAHRMIGDRMPGTARRAKEEDEARSEPAMHQCAFGIFASRPAEEPENFRAVLVFRDKLPVFEISDHRLSPFRRIQQKQ